MTRSKRIFSPYNIGGQPMRAQPIPVSSAPVSCPSIFTYSSGGRWASGINIADIPVTSSGYTGVRLDLPQELPSLEKLHRRGFKVLVCQPGETCPITDVEDRVICVVHILPPGQSRRVVLEANAAIEQAHERIFFTEKQENHRRGDFPAASYGISFGGGQTRPDFLKHSVKTNAILQSLLKHRAFNHFSDDSNYLFTTYGSQIRQRYLDGLAALQKWDPQLVPNFPGTAFAACTWNFGPAAVSYPHINDANVAFGWCSITALGDYNPDLGGHLILWDLDLVIRFPPGATILIPSALLAHSNVPIQEGEKRYAFVQFTAGGLFRWIDHDFQSVEQWEKSASEAQRQQYEKDREARVKDGYNRFSNFSEVVGGG
ncbi:hypothetical protein C8R42DRAFT_324548 [Lentinula raphanica]|nr:hypothetical protein C8R42DRAFT_324548 [Lentinula raphanica]